ncbi:hypothetical protein [Haloarchaeobius sp. DYHT-AS-18]|uniref:hypothetical protein n=1 Tax=Haloarchaeobius sp. DYHT-AS-18 TaxID=3446117 RepID=UPI003EB6ACE5
MALTDWSKESGAEYQGASNEQAQNGSFSYKAESSSGYNAIAANKQSKTDSPTEGRVQYWMYPVQVIDGSGYGIAFRLQDASNYYYARVQDYGSDGFGLMKVENGTPTKVDGSQINASLSDAVWQHFRITYWQDSGTLNVRFEVDSAGDGTWSAGASDIADPNPSFETGGGVGIGQPTSYLTSTSLDVNGYGDPGYWDEVEVFY